MAEPGLRKLDQGLPRLDMYSPAFRARQAAQKALREGVQPAQSKPPKNRRERSETNKAKPARREEAADALSLVNEARKVAEKIIAEARAEADRLLANAAEQISMVISEALGSARRIAADLELPEAPRVPVSDIIREVAAHYSVRPQDITGACCSRHVVRARYAAIAAAHRARPDLSTIVLGREFNRDHSTIIHALRKSGVRPIGENA